MHRSHPSRVRILFEVFCAFAVVASMVGAWRQTGASALLVAAAAAALLGFARLFDMPGSKSAEVAEPQRIDFEPELVGTNDGIVVPMVAVEPPTPVVVVVNEAEVEEPVASRASSGRRSGGSRKGSGRRAKAPKAAKTSEPELVEEVQAPWPLADVREMGEPAAEEEEFVFPPDDESSQPHIQPLFEPEPFVRMPRQGFGRRGRL
jgi:hypothetical protein